MINYIPVADPMTPADQAELAIHSSIAKLISLVRGKTSDSWWEFHGPDIERVAGKTTAAIADSAAEKQQRIDQLESEIRYAVTQEFDDICWHDVYVRQAAMIGIEFNPKLLPREKHARNCELFYDSIANDAEYKPETMACEQVAAIVRERDEARALVMELSRGVGIPQIKKLFSDERFFAIKKATEQSVSVRADSVSAVAKAGEIESEIRQ